MTHPSLLAPPLTILPLENGARLTRDEFERRYNTMPKVKKAELIEGIVYITSPLKFGNYTKPHTYIMEWLGIYEAATLGVELSDNVTIRLDGDNELQPEAILRLEVGGKSSISEDDYVEGAPELIVEIIRRSNGRDWQSKRQVYCRNQVQEYLVWRVDEHQFDWYHLNDGDYVQFQPNSDGMISSLVFPGLWLDKFSLLAGDLPRVLAGVRQGLATSEHQIFVQQLIVDS
ncbi:MAG TPA: Uma2 family endonuclease [Cyanobacteria bacterium UBA11149]|nr:Uma2 family endonuclease [Cyanobacteria bacterium UBA11367]HBE58561.1 Uma2 family endonuclease [Cyanobacteria bacterium UBA11366]HBK64768.1 Uma2 family endonuclease [Cyanobacteria bacterium UBA11166]HBR76503.1 Uma2 family endonuclease [Cyanobacteria bacterium UBA11159]HBS67873.1 Uma2 family endonuclease [Cyanobacteria bacterium UBA11153]HBW90088.1 Uma2 family endonuclease [Cyanobacteria bacterium UBA11149]HCA93724.1 Uma2 family endonuclease [Cyanobacteria bacterium UBA9226]